MARCNICGEQFVPTTEYNAICYECLDMGAGADVGEPDVIDELIEFVDDDFGDGQPDDLQEHEDFAHDDDFYNREDEYLDSYFESQNEYFGDE